MRQHVADKMTVSPLHRMAVVNGMLISNDFPAIERRNLLKSIVAIGVKLSKYFTTYRLEKEDIYGEAKKLKDEFEKLYFKFSDLGRFTEKELENVVGQFLSNTALGPVKDAWLANRQVREEFKTSYCGIVPQSFLHSNWSLTHCVTTVLQPFLTLGLKCIFLR